MSYTGASSDAGSAADTVVGSESGYMMRRTEDDIFEDEGETTETTGLLRAGAGAQEDEPLQGNSRKDSWVGLEDFEGLPWWKTPSVWWLLGPYAIFSLAFGGSMVPRLSLMVDLICARYFADQSARDPNHSFTPVLPGGDNPQCDTPGVQRKVATFTLIVSVLVGVLSAITAPKLGSLSDRYGRKRIMVICSLGGIVGEVITIFAAKYPDLVHYRWILFGSFFDGLTGSFTAGSVLSHSYTSDCTPPSQRGVAIGRLHACLFTGLAFGPLIAAYLVKWMGSLLFIFYVALGCHICFILFVWFVIPESLSKRKQLLAREKHAIEQEERWKRSEIASTNSLNALPFNRLLKRAVRLLHVNNPLEPLKILWPAGPGTRQLRRNLVTLALIDMAILGATMGAGTNTLLYTRLMFGWGNLETSQFMSMVSMVRVVVLMIIFPVINYYFRIRPAERERRASNTPIAEKNAGADELDIAIIRTALISDVIGVAGYIFVRTSHLFIVCAIITAFGGLGSATIQASLSKHAPPERVGQLLGAIGLLHALSRVFAPIVFNGLYALTVDVFPQAFFVLLTSTFAVALVCSFLVRPHVYMTDENEPSEPSRPSQNRSITAETLEDEEILPV